MTPEAAAAAHAAARRYTPDDMSGDFRRLVEEFDGVVLRRPVLGNDLRSAIRLKLGSEGDARAERGGPRS